MGDLVKFGEAWMDRLEKRFNEYKPRLNNILQALKNQFPDDGPAKLKSRLSGMLKPFKGTPRSFEEIEKAAAEDPSGNWLDRMLQSHEPSLITEPLRNFLKTEIRYDVRNNIYIPIAQPSEQLYKTLRRLVAAEQEDNEFSSQDKTLIAISQEKWALLAPANVDAPAPEYVICLQEKDASKLANIVSGQIPGVNRGNESGVDFIHRQRILFDALDDNLNKLKNFAASPWTARSQQVSGASRGFRP